MRVTPTSAMRRTLAPLPAAPAGNVYRPVTPWPIPTMAAGNSPGGGGK